MRRISKRSGCYLLQKALWIGVAVSLVLISSVFAEDGPSPTTKPAVAPVKYDPTLAERAKETIRRAMAEMKDAGQRITVKVKETAGVDITEQIRQQLTQFEEKARDGKGSLKDALAVIDVMQTQADSLLRFIADSKGLGLAEMKEQAVASLMQLSEQLAAKANQIEAQANATAEPEWAQKLHELAAAADRFARGYTKWADKIRAYPIEGHLRQLNAAEAYLRRVKEILDLMEDYLRMSGDFGDFAAQMDRFMTELSALHSSIQKFAKLVHDVPSEMPATEPEGKRLNKAPILAPSKGQPQASAAK